MATPSKVPNTNVAGTRARAANQNENWDYLTDLLTADTSNNNIYRRDGSGNIAEILVPTNGSISDAISDLGSTGGTVWLAPGIHSVASTITISSSQRRISIVGTSIGGINPSIGGSVLQAGAAASPIMSVDGPSTSLKNILFDGDTNSVANLLRIYGNADSTLIENCSFISSDGTDSQLYHSGDGVSNLARLRVLNCIFDYVGTPAANKYSIRLSSGTDQTLYSFILGNYISDSTIRFEAGTSFCIASHNIIDAAVSDAGANNVTTDNNVF